MYYFKLFSRIQFSFLEKLSLLMNAIIAITALAYAFTSDIPILDTMLFIVAVVLMGCYHGAILLAAYIRTIVKLDRKRESLIERLDYRFHWVHLYVFRWAFLGASLLLSSHQLAQELEVGEIFRPLALICFVLLGILCSFLRILYHLFQPLLDAHDEFRGVANEQG